jgi:hypothetical protein
MFKGWLTKKPSSDSAICTWCNAELSCKKGRNDLTKHSMSKTHKKNAAIPNNNVCIISNCIGVDNAASVVETEAKITSFLVIITFRSHLLTLSFRSCKSYPIKTF